MPINVRQVDNVDTLPPASNVREIPPWQKSSTIVDWRVVGVLCLFLLFACPLGWWLVGRDVREWVYFGWGGRVVIGSFILAFLYAAGWIVRSLLLVEQPGGFKVAIWNAHAPKVIDELIAVHGAFASTPYRGVAAQTIQYPTKIEAPPALPAPEQVDVLPPPLLAVPDPEWMAWINKTPHLMIAGRTEAGKTTLAEAVIAQRAMAGELLYVLDPHYQPGKWCGLPATGGGRGYDDVMQALGLVLDEMDQRYKDFNAGKRTEDFDRLTVFIDEVPALVEWCFDGKRLRDQRWMSFAKQLGSEARKVRISVILMTQSPLVQDIQINTRMRENFTRIALGDQSLELVREAREPRRSELERLLEGKRYTATMEYLNQVHVLDTSNVPSLAQRHVAHLARPWQPTQTKIAVAASAQPSPVVRASVAAGAIVYPPNVKSQNGRIAFLLRSGYTYRQIERELSVSPVTISQVSKALQARQNGGN